MTDEQLSRSNALDAVSSSSPPAVNTRPIANDSDRTTHQTFVYTVDESVSEAVIDAVASVSGVDSIDLEPLYYAIDPDALDVVFESRRDDGDLPPDVQVSFAYAGLQVTVTAAGQIIVDDEGPDVD